MTSTVDEETSAFNALYPRSVHDNLRYKFIETEAASWNKVVARTARRRGETWFLFNILRMLLNLGWTRVGQ